MATSGTWVWSPDLAECIDEAYERIKLDSLTGLSIDHIYSARRSINFMLSDWATKDYTEHKIEKTEYPVSTATNTVDVGTTPAGARVIDVVEVWLSRDGIDTPMKQMSSREWGDIPDKTSPGRPNLYYINQKRDTVELELWPRPENNTDVLKVDALLRFEDHDAAGQTPDIPPYMQEAFVAGLAHRLNMKWGDDQRHMLLKGEADAAFKSGLSALSAHEDIQITPGSNRRARRRR